MIIIFSYIFKVLIFFYLFKILFISKMSVSRDNNTWISEWATQVAEHNSLPPAIGGSTGRTPPLSPSKIPSPIHSRSQRLARSRNV